MTDPVYVDPITELYHTRREDAGDAATEYSRPQAERFGYAECPTCRHGERVVEPDPPADPEEPEEPEAVAGSIGA